MGLPRARGDVVLSVKSNSRGTVLDGLRQSGSYRALFPRVAPRANVARVEAVLVNTAGGITGGDRFSCCARAPANTDLTITTQTAERVYRATKPSAGDAPLARVKNRIYVGAEARVNWLAQETILFDGCAMARDLVVDMDVGASVLVVEPLVFGRAAMGEKLHDIQFHDRIEIRQNGTPIYLDAMHLAGDVTRHLAQKHIANGAGAMVSLIYKADDASAMHATLRDGLPNSGGATMIDEDLLFMRILAPDSFDLRRYLIPILHRLTNETLPRPWMS